MASTSLFDRQWKINLRVSDFIGTSENVRFDHDITGLKVTFNVVNTLLGDPSTASFQIYNAGPKTSAILAKHDCIISIYTAYNTEITDSDEGDLIFEGEITNSYMIRQDTDTVTNVWARNAHYFLNKTNPSVTPIQTETSVKDILLKLLQSSISVDDTPDYIGNAEAALDELAMEAEYSPTGTWQEELESLLNSHNFGWQLFRGKLTVFEQEDLTPQDSESDHIVISRETGLLTKPIVDYKGITFKTLLNGKLKPGGLISVDPNTVTYNLGNEFYVESISTGEWGAEGIFRVYEVTHKGDTRGQSWYTEITAFYRR